MKYTSWLWLFVHNSKNAFMSFCSSVYDLFLHLFFSAILLTRYNVDGKSIYLIPHFGRTVWRTRIQIFGNRYRMNSTVHLGKKEDNFDELHVDSSYKGKYFLCSWWWRSAFDTNITNKDKGKNPLKGMRILICQALITEGVAIFKSTNSHPDLAIGDIYLIASVITFRYVRACCRWFIHIFS